MSVNIADRIKARFEHLDVFDKIDENDVVFVRKMYYDNQVRLMEIRVEVKRIRSLLGGAKTEYWVSGRVVSIPDMPAQPKVTNLGVSVVNNKLALMDYIADIDKYCS